MDEMVEMNPWARRKQLGSARALFQTTKLILLSPGTFFAHLNVNRPVVSSFAFYVMLSFPASLIARLYEDFFVTNRWRSPSFVESTFHAVALSLLMLIGSTVFMHLFVRLFRGKEGFRATFHICSYGLGPVAVLSALPTVGNIVAFIWGIVVILQGIQRVHKLSTSRVVAFGITALLGFVLLGVGTLLVIAQVGGGALDATASARLHKLQTAIENYAAAHNGQYPLSETDLTSATPPYFVERYCGEPVGGFQFNCEFSSTGYVLKAIPYKGTLLAGTKTLIVSGGQLTVSSSGEDKHRASDP